MSIVWTHKWNADGRGYHTALVAAVVAAELLAIVAIQSLGEFGCTRDGDAGACEFFARLVIRGAAISALGALYLIARGRHLLAGVGPYRGSTWPWAYLQIAGFLLIMSPLLPGGPGFSEGAPALVVWSIGSLMAAVGAALWLMPPRDWRAVLRRDPFTFAFLAAVGLAAPELLAQVDRAWGWNPLVEVTFACVVWLLGLVGEPHVDPQSNVIALGDFAVEVGQACSGIQGLALIASFLLVYFFLQRRELAFRRAWLLLPIGLACSFALNIGRITGLILIGASGSPDLAVGGFHSHAGWLLFTLLAFALIGTSRKIAWFRAQGGAGSTTLPPLFRDPNAAMILPFIVFMLSGIVAAAAAEVPEVLYPLRAVALAATLALFAPLVRDMVAGANPLSLLAGLVIGLVWISLPGAGDGDPALAAEIGALDPVLLLVWAGFRLFGTVLLVPIAEEAFFRGYLLRRLDRGGPTRLLALVISSVLFAALHERWFVAGLAGLAFGALMLRRNRLADPIAAHVAANTVVATWAVASGDWSIL